MPDFKDNASSHGEQAGSPLSSTSPKIFALVELVVVAKDLMSLQSDCYPRTIQIVLHVITICLCIVLFRGLIAELLRLVCDTASSLRSLMRSAKAKVYENWRRQERLLKRKTK